MIDAGPSLSAAGQKNNTEKLAVLGIWISIAYAIVRSLFGAASKPFWSDEVCTLIVARQPSVSAIWKALAQPADGQPPPFYLVERAAAALLHNPQIAFRLPSICGFACTLVFVFIFVRRRSARRILGSFARLILLITVALHPYAIEARPYSLLVACIALALLCYQRAPETGWMILMGFSFAAAEALHYYADFRFRSFWTRGNCAVPQAAPATAGRVACVGLRPCASGSVLATDACPEEILRRTLLGCADLAPYGKYLRLAFSHILLPLESRHRASRSAYPRRRSGSSGDSACPRGSHSGSLLSRTCSCLGVAGPAVRGFRCSEDCPWWTRPQIRSGVCSGRSPRRRLYPPAAESQDRATAGNSPFLDSGGPGGEILGVPARSSRQRSYPRWLPSKAW